MYFSSFKFKNLTRDFLSLDKLKFLLNYKYISQSTMKAQFSDVCFMLIILISFGSMMIAGICILLLIMFYWTHCIYKLRAMLKITLLNICCIICVCIYGTVLHVVRRFKITKINSSQNKTVQNMIKSPSKHSILNTDHPVTSFGQTQ